MRQSELRAGDVIVGQMTASVYLVLRKEPGDEAWLNLHSGELHEMRDDEANGDGGMPTFAVIRRGVEIHSPR